MVGGNLTPATIATRPQRELFPQQLPITFQAVTKIDPENNRLTTERGEVYTYEQLVLLAGAQLDWGRIKGAREAV
jgi:sulfide:quinone oxidoreductase